MLTEQLKFFLLAQCEGDVFRLQVRVNELAYAVQIVQTGQKLTSDLSYQRDGDPAMPVHLNEVEQILT
jgi:Ni,Fe-hydrogenase III large subunit